MTRTTARRAAYVAAITLASHAVAAERPGAHPPLPWRLVRLEAQAGGLHGVVELTASEVPADEAAGSLRGGLVESGLVSSSPVVVVLRGTTKATLQKATRSLTWLDPSGTVLQAEEERRADRWHLRRFTAHGFDDWDARPAAGERKRPAASWTRRTSAHVAWGVDTDDLRPADAFALIWRASRMVPEEGESLKALTWSGGPARVSLEARAVETVDADFSYRVGDAEPVRVSGPRPARRLAVMAERLGGTERSAAIGVLGMRGNVELFVDVATGLPLELRGRVPLVGIVRARLTAAEVNRGGDVGTTR